VVEIVDSEERICGIVPALEDRLDGRLIAYDKVHVIRYTAHRE
jgi:PII-like signaling protein